MKLFILCFATLFPIFSLGQLLPMQSQPDIKWMKIESENFQVIYPDYLMARAKESLELLEHYRSSVIGPYKILPEKLSLIIRPEVHVPNGFVTLAPRRTEWFNFSSITPIVGSLEWFQSLAVHEYRHVVQYEYLNQGYVRWGYNLFGEAITGILINIIMPTWYFEGDAVYAETVLSDGGRGRSPRFSEGLRALLSEGEYPKYDELLAGSFTDNLPNFYVYGYYLITEGYRRFGANFWQKVAYSSTYRPWNFWAFYRSFLDHTGISFKTFYSETMEKLAAEWKLSAKSKDKVFARNIYPFYSNGKVYHLQGKLNSYWSIMKDGISIKDINLNPRLSHIDMTDKRVIYTQQLPHHRFLFQGSSDLFLINLKDGKQKKLTDKKRRYHPRFSPDETKIASIAFEDNIGFYIEILNLDGNIVRTIKTKKKNENFSEVEWISNNKLATITLNPTGEKYISTIDLESGNITPIFPASRNNIYALNSHKNFLYFEADYQGVVSIFELDYNKKTLSLCVSPKLGAHHPYKTDDKLFYSETTRHGSEIKASDSFCNEVPFDSITKHEKFISKGASDNFYQTEPVSLDTNQIKKFQTEQSSYHDHKELVTPHSWSFFSDRGFELNGTGQNMLGNKLVNAYIGSSYTNSTSYIGGSFSFAKYYPIFTISLDRANREEEINENNNTNWTETSALASMTLPYVYQESLFSGIHSLTLSKGLINASENDFQSSQKLNDENFQLESINLQSSFLKDKTLQQPRSTFGYQLAMNYYNLSIDERDENNYFAQTQLKTFLPSYFKNHTIGFNYTEESRPQDEGLYRLQQNYANILTYQFSRGHEYVFTSNFKKYSFEYTMPMTYPQTGWLDYIFVTRVYTSLFVDIMDYKVESNDRTLSSYGAEFYFDTNTFRKLPLTYGLRVLNRHGEEGTQLEIFLATILQ